jgi:hypothetical protein
MVSSTSSAAAGADDAEAQLPISIPPTATAAAVTRKRRTISCLPRQRAFALDELDQIAVRIPRECDDH